MAKAKKIDISELSAAMKERFGNLSSEELGDQLSALYACLGLAPGATEMPEEQYKLGIQVLDVSVTGQARDYQHAKELVESGQAQVNTSHEASMSREQSGSLANILEEQIDELYSEIPELIAVQRGRLTDALTRVIITGLDRRIAEGNLREDIAVALGKQQSHQVTSYEELLGLEPVKAVPSLPESSTP